MIIIDILTWIFILMSVFLMMLFMISIRFNTSIVERSVTLLETTGEYLKKHKRLESLINFLYFSGMICSIIKVLMFIARSLCKLFDILKIWGLL